MRTMLAAMLLLGASALPATQGAWAPGAWAQANEADDPHGSGAEGLTGKQPAVSERKAPIIGGMNQPDPASDAGKTDTSAPAQQQRENPRDGAK